MKKAGISSEDDLKSLDISTSDIERLKQENSNTTEKETQETSVQPSELENEKEIVVKSTKEKIVREVVFGQSIFRSGAVNIQNNSDRIVPPLNYILGSGDRLSITIWGISQFDGEFMLDEFGNINPNLIGRISLKGKTFNQAQQIIKSRFSKVYRFNSSQISINLSYSKVISVNIVGEVVSPGTFSIPSINSAFNVLSLAKGPSEKGSVRNISIIRSGKVVSKLDVYEFMNNPNNKSFIYLKDGDFLLVPTLGNVVNIQGEVIRPAQYELKEKESLATALKFAGGFNSLANKSSISIIRQTENGRLVKSYSSAEASNVELKNGDKLIISKNAENISNKVTIKGEIFAPGIYEFKNGETFNTLLSRANGLTPNAYLKNAHIYRLNKNLEREVIQIDLSNTDNIKNIQMSDLDEIFIFNKSSFIDTTYLSINGFVRQPGKVEFKNGLTLNDLITMSGGTLPQADISRIEIERIDFSKPKSDTINYVNLQVKDFASDSKFILQPYDIINIRPLPNFRFQETVIIKGQVKYPGAYSLVGNRTQLSDIIPRAGGLNNLAYEEKAYIKRSEDNVGMILLNLKTALKNNESSSNYNLRPGDTIVIPRINDIVAISGAIGAKFVDQQEKINVAFKKGKRASYYIKKFAGGYDKKANRRNVYAITLNGKIKRSKMLGLIKPKVEKGDEIIVKYLPKKEKRAKEDRIDWNGQIENLTLKLSGVATLWVLLSRVNL
ncbi:MAG: SLBB domain-containing protein [Flavobacteriales bacterium]|nr:SLBB domain-containing protein [Flavobacteriales bacterium]